MMGYEDKGRLWNALRRIKSMFYSSAIRTHFAQDAEAFRLAFFRKDVGHNTYVDPTVQVLGWRSISIGHSTAISEGTWLNVNHRTPGHKHIVIGSNCYIGKRNFFTSGWQIWVSDYCMTGVDCKLMSGDHLFESPMVPYLISGVTNEKVIRLGVNARLGAGVSVVGNVSIGHGSIIAAGSLVNKDIPPFSIAIGNPCRVHKRYDFSSNQWVDADRYTELGDHAMFDEAVYLEALIAQYPKVHIPLQAAGRSFGDMF